MKNKYNFQNHLNAASLPHTKTAKRKSLINSNKRPSFGKIPLGLNTHLKNETKKSSGIYGVLNFLANGNESESSVSGEDDSSGTDEAGVSNHDLQLADSSHDYQSENELNSIPRNAAGISTSTQQQTTPVSSGRRKVCKPRRRHNSETSNLNLLHHNQTTTSPCQTCETCYLNQDQRDLLFNNFLKNKNLENQKNINSKSFCPLDVRRKLSKVAGSYDFDGHYENLVNSYRREVLEEDTSGEENNCEKNVHVDLRTLESSSETDTDCERSEDVNSISNSNSNSNSNSKNPEFEGSSQSLIETFKHKKARIKNKSPYGNSPNWDLIPVIIKSNDNMMHEKFALIIINELHKIFTEEKLQLSLNPYKIQPIENNSGIIEMVTDGISIHQLKKLSKTDSLKEYFQFRYKDKKTYKKAVTNFTKSLAAYSIVSYILQLKDRHNGNILIDNKGYCVHIDYGFFLSSSPKNLGFESAPFKLSPEFLELIQDNSTSNNFSLFRKLMIMGFLAIKKHSDRLLDIVQIMINSPFLQFKYSHKVQEGSININDVNIEADNNPLIYYENPVEIYESFKYRLHDTLTEKNLEKVIDELIENARSAWSTPLYDKFQYWTNGIL